MMLTFFIFSMLLSIYFFYRIFISPVISFEGKMIMFLFFFLFLIAPMILCFSENMKVEFFLMSLIVSLIFCFILLDLIFAERDNLLVREFDPLISSLDDVFNEYKDEEISSKIKKNKEEVLSMINKIRIPESTDSRYPNRTIILLKNGYIIDVKLSIYSRFYYDGSDFIFDKKEVGKLGRNETILNVQKTLDKIEKNFFNDNNITYCRESGLKENITI